MFDLAYPINDSVEIDGMTYAIDLSFDNVLRVFDLLNDDEVGDMDKTEIGLLMLINDELEEYDIQEKIDIFVEVFKSTIGKEAEENQPLDIEGNPMPAEYSDNKKVYSIKEDAEYIYASFYQDYGIDLIEMQGKLHWNKFKALLGGLRKDTRFKEVVEIRQMDLPSGKGNQKQREQVKKLKKQYALKEE